MIEATKFHNIADTLLQKLSEQIEDNKESAEAEYLQGILNIELGDGRKYVLNKHEPTRQIWLSSPISGSHKFKYDENNNKWIGYEGEDLLNLINSEITK